MAAGNGETNYALGSVLNHVLLHQTVIGQEAMAQMEKAGEYPDTLIGCVGGGSNFAGLAIPYMLGVLLICAGLVVGGTIGFALAYGSLLALLAAVVTGILRFIRTDDE